jgi:hypothetical protein
MAITNSNLFSQSYTSIKSFLDGITSLDPRSRFKANWIHASMPNINSKGFDGYPFIVVQTTVSKQRKSFQSSISEKLIRANLIVYSDEATEIDTISDSITSSLEDETKLTDFQVKDIGPSPIDYDLDLNGKKIVFRNLGVILRCRV